MVGDFVMTQKDIEADLIKPDAIGMGSYNMDSHHCQRYIDENGHVRNEGDIQVSPGGPYLISYRAIVPKREECTNLFVPVCLSSSHIAYGSIRMEPTFMILGQSAALADITPKASTRLVVPICFITNSVEELADGEQAACLC